MLKKLFAVLVVLIMSVASLSACTTGDPNSPYDNNVADSEKTLDIMAVNKGYGLKWLDALVKEYKSEHPDVTVSLKTEIDDSNISAMLEMGIEHSRFDLYFAGMPFKELVDQALTNDPKNVLASLNDVYESKPDGKEKISETLDESVLSFYKLKAMDNTDAYYAFPWTQSVSGLLVNNAAVVKVLGEDWHTNYKIRTTEELVEVAEALKGKLPAFMYCADTHFYHFLYETWWAQYEGLSKVADFYSGLADDPLGGKKLSPAIFLQEGRLKAMEALESIMAPGKGYCYSNSYSISWNEAQTRFMIGEAGFFPNGDWHVLEMEKSFPNSDIRFIKTPVVSSLGTKLGISEKDLCAVIDYVDAVNDGAEPAKPAITISPVNGNTLTVDAVIAEVRSARNLTFSYINFNNAYVANYGKGRELAKDFLKFMASEKGQKIYATAMNGPTLPFGYDVSKDSEIWNNFSGFAKSRWDAAKSAEYYFRRTDLPLGAVGLIPFRASESAPLEAQMNRTNDTKTAADIANLDYQYYSKGTAWNDLLKRAGIIN